MKPSGWSQVLSVAVFSLVLVFLAADPSAGAAQYARSVGPAQGTLVLPRDESPQCGYLRINSDATYENGYAWGYLNPTRYYGAFAECFLGQHPEVCSLVFDLTGVGYPRHTLDALVWDDDAGMPGTVLCVTPDVDPGPIALWPDISRHIIDLNPKCYPETAWWAGFWGNWGPHGMDEPGFYIAADVDGTGPGGCPFTNIEPGIGYPTGWHDVSVVWGPTRALGIGIEAHTLLPAAVPIPGAAGEFTSWGKVKGLYR
jgi:hypothetical protein